MDIQFKKVGGIYFNLAKSGEHFFEIIQKSLEVLHYGLRLTEYSKDIPENLPESVECIFLMKIWRLSSDFNVKNELRSKIITICIEDLSKGVMLTLVDTLVTLNMARHASKFGFDKTSDFQKKSIQAGKKISKYNFPTLVQKIESFLGEKLFYTDYIRSIQKARNCLTHRNGEVTYLLDTNNKTNNTLEIMYYQIINDLTDEDKKNSNVINTVLGDSDGENIPASFKPYIKEFRIGSKVEFTFNEVQCISFTCYQFIDEIIKKGTKVIERYEKTFPKGQALYDKLFHS